MHEPIYGREPGTSNEKPNWCIAAMAEGQPKTETVDPLVRLGAVKELGPRGIAAASLATPDGVIPSRRILLPL